MCQEKKVSILIQTIQCFFRTTSKQVPTFHISPTTGNFICQLAKTVCCHHWVTVKVVNKYAGRFFVLCVKPISLHDSEGVSPRLTWVIRALNPLKWNAAFSINPYNARRVSGQGWGAQETHRILQDVTDHICCKEADFISTQSGLDGSFCFR